jgi:hypothetical protein
MNGTANARTKGGTALDIATSGQFLRQWAAVANNKTTGGAATDSVTVASHSGSSIDSAIEIANHSAGTSGTASLGQVPNHFHTLTRTQIDQGTGDTFDVVNGEQTSSTVEGDDHGYHNHTTPALSHTITSSSALAHAAVTVDTVPPFMYVGFLERLNNSRSGLGL